MGSSCLEDGSVVGAVEVGFAGGFSATGPELVGAGVLAANAGATDFVAGERVVVAAPAVELAATGKFVSVSRLAESTVSPSGWTC